MNVKMATTTMRQQGNVYPVHPVVQWKAKFERSVLVKVEKSEENVN